MMGQPGGNSIKVERGCPHGSLPYSIADHHWWILKARLFLERAAFDVDSSRTGLDRLI